MLKLRTEKGRQQVRRQIARPHIYPRIFVHLTAKKSASVGSFFPKNFCAFVKLLIIDQQRAPLAGDVLEKADRTVDAQIGKPFGFLDVTGDDFVAADDALAVINAINAGQGGEGEEAEGRIQNSEGGIETSSVGADEAL